MKRRHINWKWRILILLWHGSVQLSFQLTLISNNIEALEAKWKKVLIPNDQSLLVILVPKASSLVIQAFIKTKIITSFTKKECIMSIICQFNQMIQTLGHSNKPLRFLKLLSLINIVQDLLLISTTLSIKDQTIRDLWLWISFHKQGQILNIDKIWKLKSTSKETLIKIC